MGMSNFKILDARGTYKNVNIDQLKKIEVRNSEFPTRFINTNVPHDDKTCTKSIQIRDRDIDDVESNIFDVEDDVADNADPVLEHTHDNWCNISEKNILPNRLRPRT